MRAYIVSLIYRYRAFIGANNLERYFLPRIGELAAQWVEEE